MNKHFPFLSLAVAALIAALLFTAPDAFARAGGFHFSGGHSFGGHGFGGSFGGFRGRFFGTFSIFNIISLIFILPIATLFGIFIPLRIALKCRAVSAALRQMAQREPQWAERNLIDIAAQNFLLLQEAWSQHNLPLIKEHLSPQLYEEWEIQIEKQISVNQRNVMSNVFINKVRIVNAQNFRDNQKDEFTAAIDASALDQIIDNGNGHVIQEENGTFREFWTFAWNDGTWLLKQVDQADGWRQHVNALIVHEALTNPTLAKIKNTKFIASHLK